MNISEVYCAGRQAIAEDLFKVIGNGALAQEAIWLTLWSPFYCSDTQLPLNFYAYDKWKYRKEVVGFTNPPPPKKIENIKNQYLRLQTNTSYYLPLKEYKNFDHFYESLSKKLKRKLRGLDPVYADDNIQFVSMKTEADINEFLDIFKAQRPNDAWVNHLRPYLLKIYMRLEETGRNCSFLLKDSQGNSFAGLLTYLTDYTPNWHLLSRRPGTMDKYAPGVFMVYKALQYFFTETKYDYVVYGPGEYDWKNRFLGREIPVFCYESLKVTNAIGLAVLFKKWLKERKKQATNNQSED